MKSVRRLSTLDQPSTLPSGVTSLNWNAGLAAYGYPVAVTGFSTSAPSPAIQRPANTMKERSLQKVGSAVKLNKYTLQPELPNGVHEVHRQKIGNPLAWHYGVAVTQYGYTQYFDLQFKDGSRRGLAHSTFAEGNLVYMTKSLPPGPEMTEALRRLETALAEYRKWTLFDNNFEHWTTYVVRGEKSSGQSRGVGIVAGVLIIAAVLSG